MVLVETVQHNKYKDTPAQRQRHALTGEFRKIEQKSERGKEEVEFIRKLFHNKLGQKGAGARQDTEFIWKLFHYKLG